MNLRTWGEQIELSADRLDDQRTRVRVVVHARQVVDWGSHDEVVATIRARLSGPTAGDRAGSGAP